MKSTGLGTILWTERMRRRWTLQTLAEKCAEAGFPVTRQALNEIELGHTTQPTMRVIQGLAAAFGIAVRELAYSIYVDQPETPTERENGRRAVSGGKRRGTAIASTS